MVLLSQAEPGAVPNRHRALQVWSSRQDPHGQMPIMLRYAHVLPRLPRIPVFFADPYSGPLYNFPENRIAMLINAIFPDSKNRANIATVAPTRDARLKVPPAERTFSVPVSALVQYSMPRTRRGFTVTVPREMRRRAGRDES